MTGGGGWNNWWDFHGGGILEWGSHTVDLCQWAADCDDTHAVEYEPKGANGGPYSVNCRYPNGVKLVMRDGIELGGNVARCRLAGHGFVQRAVRGRQRLGGNRRRRQESQVSDNLKSQLPPPDNSSDFNLALHYHWRDFIECIKTRSQPRANADHAANTHITCHAAYIAFQLGRKLTWDPAKEEFVGDAEANRMRARAMREPWRI